jgi:hypothetical protein
MTDSSFDNKTEDLDKYGSMPSTPAHDEVSWDSSRSIEDVSTNQTPNGIPSDSNKEEPNGEQSITIKKRGGKTKVKVTTLKGGIEKSSVTSKRKNYDTLDAYVIKTRQIVCKHQGITRMAVKLISNVALTAATSLNSLSNTLRCFGNRETVTIRDVILAIRLIMPQHFGNKYSHRINPPIMGKGTKRKKPTSTQE